MRIQLQGPSHAASLLVELNRCRQACQYCDVFLQVGNRTFAAHRAVLACAGTYFRDLFTRVPAATSAVFLPELISPANFEKVLTFVYTGGIFIDLIDVGVLYELAERLGIRELVRACHATLPDLQASVSAKCKISSLQDLPLDTSRVAASSVIGAVSVPTTSVLSSTASCSSLSSVAGSFADATPVVGPLPLSQTRTARPDGEIHTAFLSEVKKEDIQSNFTYGKLVESSKLQGGNILTKSNFSDETDRVSPSVIFQLKTEQGLVDGEAGVVCDDGDTCDQMLSESKVSGSLPQSCDPSPSDSCSLPESSSQVGPAPISFSGEDRLGSLRLTSVEGSMMDVQKDSRLELGEFSTVETGEDQDASRGDETMERMEEEQQRHLAGEIIELSDDEYCMAVTDKEDDDEDKLVCAAGEGEMEGVEGMHCFLCPQTFCSSSAFQDHLTQHTSSHESMGHESHESLGQSRVIGSPGLLGKRKADQYLDCPASSCSSSSSAQDFGGLVKIDGPGSAVEMGGSISENFIQRPVHNYFSRVLTNRISGQEDGGGASGVRDKWYRCRFCSKCFAHSGEFTYHLRIHTGEKPYQCKVCLRFFRGRSTMICHLKTHEGALMYRCTVCGLYFSTMKLVSSHMELHKNHLPPDFNIEQTFMYNDHSKGPLVTMDT